MDAVAWFDRNGLRGPQPVKRKQPNELGLYDMSGNVWEWCEDIYGMYSQETLMNPKGATSGNNHVLRGGCWRSNEKLCRVASRTRNDPSACDPDYGFRLAMS